jgi:hypothetical protein
MCLSKQLGRASAPAVSEVGHAIATTGPVEFPTVPLPRRCLSRWLHRVSVNIPFDEIAAFGTGGLVLGALEVFSGTSVGSSTWQSDFFE